MGGITDMITGIVIGGVALFLGAILIAMAVGFRLGVEQTEKRWTAAVTRAGVSAVRRCDICGCARGERT